MVILLDFPWNILSVWDLPRARRNSQLRTADCSVLCFIVEKTRAALPVHIVRALDHGKSVLRV